MAMFPQLHPAPAGGNYHHHRHHHRRRSVTFNHNVVLHRTAALSDYTAEERSACFVSDEDWFEMREGAKRTVIQARRKAARAKYRKQEPTMPNHHDGSDDSDESGGCLRGLEHLFDSSVLAKKEKRRRAVRAAVLSANDSNGNGNGNGSAGVYPSVSVNSKAKAAFRAQVEAAEATFRASRDAAEVGAQDAAIAAKIHAESIHHQDPMDMDMNMDIDTALLNARKFDAAAESMRNVEFALAAARKRLVIIEGSSRGRSSLTPLSSSGTGTGSASSSASDVPSLEAMTVSPSATTMSSISSSSTISSSSSSSLTSASSYGAWRATSSVTSWKASDLMERFRSLSTRRERIIEQIVPPTTAVPQQHAAAAAAAEPFKEEDAAGLLLRLRSVAGRHSTIAEVARRQQSIQQREEDNNNIGMMNDVVELKEAPFEAAALLDRIHAITGRHRPSPSRPEPDNNPSSSSSSSSRNHNKRELELVHRLHHGSGGRDGDRCSCNYDEGPEEKKMARRGAGYDGMKSSARHSLPVSSTRQGAAAAACRGKPVVEGATAGMGSAGMMRMMLANNGACQQQQHPPPYDARLNDRT